MITRKTRNGLIALVLLTTVSFWVSREQDGELPGPVAGLDPKLDYALRDFELQFFDDNGQPTINMQAPVLKNNPKLQRGTVEQPVIKLIQPDAVWDITADAAIMTADKEHIQLSGRVHVQRREPTSGIWAELKTREVRIEVTPQTASTDQSVSMFDGLNRMDAMGMNLDMKNGKFQLYHRVKATYAVN